jgi:hypothetical protein
MHVDGRTRQHPPEVGALGSGQVESAQHPLSLRSIQHRFPRRD